MRKALVVGINDYPKYPLNICINNARNVAKMLCTHEDGNKNFDVILRENVETKDELMGLIDLLFRGKPEVAFFYFSGHGFFDEAGGYIVTPDCCNQDIRVSMKDILRYANASRAENKVIILDCCHTGEMRKEAPENRKEAIAGMGVTILASCRDKEDSLETGESVFTGLLLEALNGGAADHQGQITPESVYAFIGQALGAEEQNPIFKTYFHKFVSLRNVVTREV